MLVLFVLAANAPVVPSANPRVPRRLPSVFSIFEYRSVDQSAGVKREGNDQYREEMRVVRSQHLSGIILLKLQVHSQ